MRKSISDLTPQPRNLKLRVITWNIGKNKKTQKEWQQEVEKTWDLVTRKDFDILVVCLQEDFAGSYGKLGDAIGNVLKDGYIEFSHVVNGPPDIAKHPFSVKVFLYIKKGTGKQNYMFHKADVCFKKAAIYCTKAAVGVSVSVYGFQFIAISAHLPINTKKPDLGYDERVDAFHKLFTEVYDKLADPHASQKAAVIAGDLNFRDDTPVAGNIVKDQLQYAMQNNPKIFDDFIEVDLVQFPPTCKLKACSDGSCPACRKNSFGQYDPDCYEREVKNKGSREPSHCDRILYKQENLNFKGVVYRSWGRSDAVAHSDHDLVYADFEIHD